MRRACWGNLLIGLLLAASLVLYLLLGYEVQRDDLVALWSCYAGLFAAWFLLLRLGQARHLRLLLISAVLFRLVLAFGLPLLSDDFYRFVWDGRLSAQGENPFAELPEERLSRSPDDPALAELYPLLNSPRYYTVYPPFCQAVFATACWLFPRSLLASVVAMKLVIVLMELASLLLLGRLLEAAGKPANLSLLYALNPLVIVELTGNLHFEAAMVCFCLASVWWLSRERWLLAALALSLAVASKLIPLIFLPLLLPRLSWRRNLAFHSGVLTLSAASFLPFLGLRQLPNFLASVGLYYQKFHFNAGLYRLLRTALEAADELELAEQSALLLAPAVVLGIVVVAWSSRKGGVGGLLEGMHAALFIYLLGASIVHPWYACPLLAFAPFARTRVAVLWSVLLPLTYITYATLPWGEWYGLTGLEYGALAGYLLGSWRVSGASFSLCGPAKVPV